MRVSAIAILLSLVFMPICTAKTITLGKDSRIVGQTVDAEGADVAIKITAGKVRITDCTVRNAKTYLVDVNGSADVTIEGCTFEGALYGVRFKGDSRGKVINCRFRDWLHYAVDIQGTAKASPHVTVNGNEFSDPRRGVGGARQMIVCRNPEKVANLSVQITNNRCIGPGEYYDAKDPNSRGTADQIVLHYCRDFLVSGNTSTGGGENGLSITFDSNHGIVSNNQCGNNDGHGIQVGKQNSKPEPGATDVLVIGNHCFDNGTRKDSSAPDSMAGIYIQDAARISLQGNFVSDSQATRGQRYGILIGSSTAVDVGSDNTILFVDRRGVTDIAAFASELVKAVK